MSFPFKYQIPGILLLSLFLCACEGSTDFERVIVNNTDTNIEVFIDTESQPSKEFTVAAGESETLFITLESGGEENAIDPSREIESMLVTKNQVETLTKDFRDPDNWEIDIEQTRKVPPNYYHTYTFTINSSDF